MVDARFVPYDDETYRAQFYELNLEFLTYANTTIFTNKGYNLIPDGDVQGYLDSVFPQFTAIKQPEGIICILEVDGEPVGMGVLKTLEDGVGEIKRMYIRPRTQGKGYGKKILRWLEEKAVEFGFSKLRLDTSEEFSEVAVHIYRKAGFKKIESYSGDEWENQSKAQDLLIYMEKEL